MIFSNRCIGPYTPNTVITRRNTTWQSLGLKTVRFPSVIARSPYFERVMQSPVPGERTNGNQGAKKRDCHGPLRGLAMMDQENTRVGSPRLPRLLPQARNDEGEEGPHNDEFQNPTHPPKVIARKGVFCPDVAISGTKKEKLPRPSL